LIDPEAAFTGALLHQTIDTAAAALELVDAADLADPHLAEIVTAVGELLHQGVAADPVTVLSHLRTSGTVAGAQAVQTISAVLVDVYGAVPVPASIMFYAQAVLDEALRRRCSELAAGCRVRAAGHRGQCPRRRVSGRPCALQPTRGGSRRRRAGQPAVGERMTEDGRKLRVRSLQEVKIVPTRYLWTDYLPVAELAMLVGKPGVGKSTVAADVAAKLTTGQLDGSFCGQPQNVLYSLTEDSEGVFKARFVAAGGDVARLSIVDVVHGQSDGSPMLVDADLDALRLTIAQLRPALVVLDALNSSLDGQVNDNSNIRPQLEKLKSLAHQTNTAVLGIGHFRKSTNGSEPLDSIGGAGAYGQVIRQALGCARDEDEGACTLSVIKTNGQSLDVASLLYRIEEAQVPSDDGGLASVGRVEWLGESETSVRDLLQQTPQGVDDRSEREEAADWLVDFLVSNGGEAPAKDVFKSGQAEGYSRDALKRAKGRRVRSEKAGFGSGWVWRLAVSSDEGSTKGAKSADLGVPLPSLPSVLPSDDTCPDHPGERLTDTGKCVSCIVERSSRLTVVADRDIA
jgi:hypothetical protein